MRSPTRALTLLALGLGLGGLQGDALAAPSTPPPPRVTTTPPPPSTSKATPPPPSQPSQGQPSQGQPSQGQPSQGGRPSPPPPQPSGSSSTPPPPTAGTPPPGAEPTGPAGVEPEPEAPPQDLSNTWGFSRSQPLQPRYVRTDDPTYAAPNPVGFYSGVSVQGNHVPPFPAKQTGAPPTVLTWTGFERAPEGSRVFFELSAEAVYEAKTDGLTIRIRMRNTKVNVRNNTRHLDLRYFKTPVRTVKVARKGRDTIATVVLKRDAIPNLQIIDGKAGYKLLVMQFGDVEPTDADAYPVPGT